MSYRDNLHKVAVETIEKILRHYGFSVQREYRLSSGERIDLFAWKNSLTIAIEISRTSDLAKDINKLLKSNAIHKFIVVLKPYDIPPSITGNIQVVHLEDFEVRLRRILKISLNYPRALSFLPPLPLYSLSEFESVLEELGFKEYVESALKLLLRAYLMGGEIPTRLIHWPHPLEKPIREVLFEDPRIINLLVGLGLTHGESGLFGNYEEGKIFGVTLSEVGVSIVKSYEKHLLDKHRDKIMDKCLKNKSMIAFITSCAFLIQRISGHLGLSFPLKNDYKNALLHIETSLSEWVITKLPYPSELLFFCISAFKLPKILDEGIKILKDLEETGLILISSYDSKGRKCEEYCIYASEELLRFTCDLLYKDVIARLNKSNIHKKLNTLNALYTLTRLQHQVRPERLEIEFEKVLDLLGLEIKDLESIAEVLYLRGASSKLIDKEPYLVILDKDKFIDILIEYLKEIENEILHHI